MNGRPNVVIVLARCAHSKQPFGIRFEEVERGRWAGNWAFAIKEQVAKREGYDRGTISGVISFAHEYPNCPYCHAVGIFKCGCGKVNCWDGETLEVTCAWCGQSRRLSGAIQKLDVGEDR